MMGGPEVPADWRGQVPRIIYRLGPGMADDHQVCTENKFKIKGQCHEKILVFFSSQKCSVAVVNSELWKDANGMRVGAKCGLSEYISNVCMYRYSK